MTLPPNTNTLYNVDSATRREIQDILIILMRDDGNTYPHMLGQRLLELVPPPPDIAVRHFRYGESKFTRTQNDGSAHTPEYGQVNLSSAETKTKKIGSKPLTFAVAEWNLRRTKTYIEVTHMWGPTKGHFGLVYSHNTAEEWGVWESKTYELWYSRYIFRFIEKITFGMIGIYVSETASYIVPKKEPI